MFDKIVIVTKETQMDQLVRTFATKDQAKFYMVQAATSKLQAKSNWNAQGIAKKAAAEFEEIRLADGAYKEALRRCRAAIPAEEKVQHIDWSYLPTFLFGEKDLVIALGQDGLVINIAKYLGEQPIVAVNPDPARFDGVLLPFTVPEFEKDTGRLLRGEFDCSPISIARAALNDGQAIYGVNDLFIGPRSHISFRYTLSFGGREEAQCSSGIIVSTGCGSTGWFRSVIEGARRISSSFHHTAIPGETGRFGWDADHLYFSVREPFESRTSGVSLAFGTITKDTPLTVTSQMPRNGVIFSDGIEGDYLEFNSGKTATVTLAERKARLVKNRPR